MGLKPVSDLSDGVDVRPLGRDAGDLDVELRAVLDGAVVVHDQVEVVVRLFRHGEQEHGHPHVPLLLGDAVEVPGHLRLSFHLLVVGQREDERPQVGKFFDRGDGVGGLGAAAMVFADGEAVVVRLFEGGVGECEGEAVGVLRQRPLVSQQPFVDRLNEGRAFRPDHARRTRRTRLAVAPPAERVPFLRDDQDRPDRAECNRPKPGHGTPPQYACDTDGAEHSPTKTGRFQPRPETAERCARE